MQSEKCFNDVEAAVDLNSAVASHSTDPGLPRRGPCQAYRGFARGEGRICEVKVDTDVLIATLPADSPLQ